MSTTKQKTDWATQFQAASEGKPTLPGAPTAEFGARQPIEEMRDYHRGEFSENFPAGASRRPDYDDFGAAAPSKFKVPILTAAQRRAHMRRQAGLHGEGSEFGGFFDGIAHALSSLAAPFTIGTGSREASQAAARAQALAAARLRARGASAARMRAASAGAPPPPSAAHGADADGVGAHGVGQSFDFESAADIDLAAFSGEPEKKGVPGWVVGILGILGIWLGAEALSHKGQEFARGSERYKRLGA